MFYRAIIFAIGLLLIGLLFGLFWASAALFMRSRNDHERLFERSRIIAIWTFAGFGVGLLFVGFGGPILGTYAFFRAARGTVPSAPEATIILWGLATTVLSTALAAGILVTAILAVQ